MKDYVVIIWARELTLLLAGKKIDCLLQVQKRTSKISKEIIEEVNLKNYSLHNLLFQSNGLVIVLKKGSKYFIALDEPQITADSKESGLCFNVNQEFNKEILETLTSK